MPKPRYFKKAEDFRTWLERHAGTADELLVGFHKVGSGRPSMSWSESVDEALCFGWIDGVRRRIDDTSYTIRFTPRRPGSNWSAVNIAKVASLQEQGRMREAGLAAFGRRTEKKSGVYAYEQEETAGFAPDEERAFRRRRRAWTFFEGTPPSYRKVVLHWVTSAKKPETRARRLAQLVEACARGERLR